MHSKVIPRRRFGVVRWGLLVVCGLFLVQASIGWRWGLPSRTVDRYLFPGQNAWTGARAVSLIPVEDKLQSSRGADVDRDPIQRPSGAVIDLIQTPSQAAATLLRYRLYTYQPDEMITMMALAQMNPAKGVFDPKLYQYGGYFIYPVGAIIRACGWLGFIDVRSDLAFYFDHPAEFGKFYLASRCYAAGWGLAALIAVFSIASKLCGGRAGLLATGIFFVSPVVVCMSHEGKPHLPGAALMLIAVRLAMNSAASSRWFYGACACVGLAIGMVLSAAPLAALILLSAAICHWDATARRLNVRGALVQAAAGGCVASMAYFVGNPYVLLNLFFEPEILRSNFGNSFAMYEFARLGEGLIRALALTAHGASWTALMSGIAGFTILFIRGTRHTRMLWACLLIPAALFFAQFASLAAGKPSEYGRFGVFPCAALTIGAGALIDAALRLRPRSFAYRSAAFMLGAFLMIEAVRSSMHYLRGFHLDAQGEGTRMKLAEIIRSKSSVGLLREPAPYCCPPLDFQNTELRLYPTVERFAEADLPGAVLVYPVDDPESPFNPSIPAGCRAAVVGDEASPISWANKCFLVVTCEQKRGRMTGDDPFGN